MADPTPISDTLDRYVETFNSRDRQGWVSLFTNDARQEDPVGQPANIGHDAIGAFFDMVGSFGTVSIEMTRPPIVMGSEALMFLKATTVIGEDRVVVPTIVDHVVCADDGRIASLRAFWDQDSIGT